MVRLSPTSTLFPYTTLFRSAEVVGDVGPSLALLADRIEGKLNIDPAFATLRNEILAKLQDRAEESRFPLDRKSTRLNSSHSQISYAVFCLKKKKDLL